MRSILRAIGAVGVAATGVAATGLHAPPERNRAHAAPAAPAVDRRELWSLRDRTAVVTGGSKGLGRAVLEELLAQGVTVLTCARDVTPLQDLLESEPRCHAVAADVSTAEGRASLLVAVKDLFGEDGLDILVNNVGARAPAVRTPAQLLHVPACTRE